MNRSIKMMLCAATLGISTVTVAADAGADEQCGGSSMAAQIFDNFQDNLKGLGCKKVEDCVSKRKDIFEQGTKFWNMMVGNSWAAIGPRELELDKELKGTVVNPGERRFLSKLPIIDHDTVKIAFTKQGGQAETDIRIYRYNAQKQCDEVAHDVVPKGDGNYQKTFTLTQVRGTVLTVRITPKGVGRKLEYTLLAKGQ